MNTHTNNQTTLDDLAVMINKGFTETQTHLDQRLDTMEGVLNDAVEELTATHADVRYLRSSVDILTRNEAERDALVKDLVARVHRLEQKAGLAK